MTKSALLSALLTLVLTLVAAYGLFHFKSQLGLFIVPIFMLLVFMVTFTLHRLLESKMPQDV
ncbi:hypothetical protein FJQ87_10850 [Shewanella sp. SNU WT4]|uniref:hypothetical protein n=1 Tax=Shewanella sp. SNU WT4 TaxID=2590015 RepID=UPI00112CB929|nr:hypothetical protein [Shewanella sp. SNU WT4]QDF67131.1 hypothetical protein FJQ87_10850 [Shewanella sp. SNU WT4]